MVTMAQRIEQLRTERNLSRPALAATLGLQKMAIEKFETGRQTPSQEQQNKMAAYFGVSVFYLRGENDDRTRMDDWMDSAFMVETTALIPKKTPISVSAPSGGEQGSVFDSFLRSEKFQTALHTVMLEVLQTPEGQKILAKAIREELSKQ